MTKLANLVQRKRVLLFCLRIGGGWYWRWKVCKTEPLATARCCICRCAWLELSLQLFCSL